ncbi:MAG: tetratricopeptide repeat protein [Cytophagales bacterium]|nr:tetratricopeptide repeat protein [Cytophagales bacterium]
MSKKNKNIKPISSTTTKVKQPIAKPQLPSWIGYYKKQFYILRLIKSIPAKCRAYFRHFIITPIYCIKNYYTSSPNLRNQAISRGLFTLIFVCSLIIMPLLSFDYGISWDEKVQRDYGKDIIKYFESGKRDTTIFDMNKHLYFTMLYYGCSFDVVTGAIHSKLMPDTDEFALRHFINAIFGVVLMLYTGLAAKHIGGWRLGLTVYIFTWCTPTIFGHSMNNPKDIPFAMWYIIAIYYMFRYLARLPKPRLSDMIGIAIGIGGAISIRVGGLILIPFLALFTGVHWLWSAKVSAGAAISKVPKYGVLLLFTSLSGYLLGLLVWPYGQRDPIKNPLNALKNLSNVNYLHTYENYNGERVYMSDLPWHYVPVQMSLGSPLYVLLGVLICLLLTYYISKKYNLAYLLLLLFILVFPIFWVVYKHSMVYNGWRHFIFTYLSLAIMAGIGWEYICFHINTHKYIKYSMMAICLILVAKVVVFIIKEHPNQYIYFNEIAGGTRGAHANYELDYYSNTVRQGVEWLVSHEPVKNKKIKLCSNNELLTVTHYTDKLADSIQVVWTRDYERQKQDWDYAIFTSRTYSPFQIKNKYFPPKGTIHTIDVDGVPVCAIVKRENKETSVGYSFSTKNRYAEALPHYLAATTYNPSDEEAYRMAALCLLNLDRGEEALEYLHKSIALNPDNFMAYFLKGYYYLSKNNLTEAEKMYKLSIKYRINNGDAHAELGNIYLNNGLYNQALKCYTDAIGFGNAQPGTFTNLGITYINLSEYNKAINVLGMALDKNPGFIPAYEQLITCFERLGDPATANQVRARIQQLRGG